MAARTTRTLNPLPFADLEPHRFEDLVRQLAYEFRPWHSLEAIGRSGSDEGIDIRGQEIVTADDERDEVVDDDQPEPGPQSRTWIFQCKREKTMGPKRVRDAVAESISSSTTAPYGFVLATSADLSKKARDAFRAEMAARGVEEFHAWARGELEDMLVQPRNDRLLLLKRIQAAREANGSSGNNRHRKARASKGRRRRHTKDLDGVPNDPGPQPLAAS